MQDVLETRRIRLRETQDKDRLTIFKWRNSEKFRLLLHRSTEEISFEEFCGEFSMEFECYKYRSIIVRKQDELPIGLIYLDTFSDTYKSCFINVFIDEPFEKKGYGIDAFIMLTLFLFEREGLKKVFARAFDFNQHSISVIRSIGMKELIGNVTKVIRQGEVLQILCFAAEENIVPRLKRINEYLSRNKKIFYSPHQS